MGRARFHSHRNMRQSDPKSGHCLVPILDHGPPEGKSAITKVRVWASCATLTTDSPCS
jgi:hypothetical protein